MNKYTIKERRSTTRQAVPSNRKTNWLGVTRYTRKQAKSVTASDLQIYWSGRRESNPRHQLGRLGFYH